MQHLKVFLLVLLPVLFVADHATSQELGPIGPSPYDVVEGWHKPFAAEGFAFGGNSGVFAESPDRIFISQRGETRLPNPVPSGFDGYVGSIGINALREAELRTWQNCLMVVDGDGNLIEVWDQWDHLCDESEGPGPHRIRISPYDPERRVWVINESRHQIFVFSNDGRELLMTLGEKNVAGNDRTHFGRPQDVAFLPDGRVLVADGLDNHRVVIMDSAGNYLSEFGGFGEGPGQFNGIHALGIGPNGLIFALDRANGRVQVFRLTDESSGTYHSEIDYVDEWTGFGLPLDLIVNDDHVWVSDLRPLKMVKLDFEGNRLYTWNVSNDGPTGYLEVHAFSVDSEGNLYGGDNQHGRTQKLVPKPDADPTLLIASPFVQR
jgi:DNA-binding beta-propeller fold protein YncE